MHLSGVEGTLGDRLEWRGEGSVEFAYHTVEPATAFGRISIGSDIVYPAMGKIDFQVHNGRIHITRLKDVFNEGKMVKFRLADRNTPFKHRFRRFFEYHCQNQASSHAVENGGQNDAGNCGDLKRADMFRALTGLMHSLTWLVYQPACIHCEEPLVDTRRSGLRCLRRSDGAVRSYDALQPLFRAFER